MRQSRNTRVPSTHRPSGRGRADVLIILVALLVTGLVAAGVVLVLFGDSGKTQGIVPVGQQQDRSLSEVASAPPAAHDGSGRTVDKPTPAPAREGGKSDRQLNKYATEGTFTSPEVEAKQRAIAEQAAGNRGMTPEQAQLARKYPDQGSAARSADEMEKERRAAAAKVEYTERVAAASQGARTRTRTPTGANQPVTSTTATTSGSGKGAIYGGTANGGTANGGVANRPAVSGGARSDGTSAPAIYTGVEKTTGNGADAAAGESTAPQTGVYREDIGEIVDQEDLIQYYDPPAAEETPGQTEPEPEPEEPPIQLDGGAAYLQIPESISVGSTVQLPLIIDTGGRYLAAYGLELAWDNSILSVDSVDPGNGAFDPPFVINLENDKGQLRFNGISITPRAAGLVNVATLTVTVHNRPSSGVATIRPLSGNQTVAVYADDGTTPMTIPSAAFVTAQLRLQ